MWDSQELKTCRLNYKKMSRKNYLYLPAISTLWCSCPASPQASRASCWECLRCIWEKRWLQNVRSRWDAEITYSLWRHQVEPDLWENRTVLGQMRSGGAGGNYFRSEVENGLKKSRQMIQNMLLLPLWCSCNLTAFTFGDVCSSSLFLSLGSSTATSQGTAAARRPVVLNALFSIRYSSIYTL